MKKRIEWVDMAKGFAIILVMIGHLPNVKLPVKTWLYTFHIPLFFFLSGYVFKIEKYVDFKSLIISKIKTLLSPMVIMGLINAVWLFFLEPSNGIKSIIYRMIGNFVELRGSKLDSGLWFIACLFVTEIMYWVMWKKTKGVEKNIVIFLLVSSMVGYVYLRWLGYIIPWSLEVTLISIGFFGCGHLLKEHKNLFDMVCQLKFFVIFVIANIGVTYFNYKMGILVDLYANQIGIYPVFYVGAFSGILMGITIFRTVQKSNLLSYLGRNSFIFYAFHTSIFGTLDKMLKPISLNISSNFECFVYMVITIFIIIIIVEIINRYVPWILGKSRKDRK